MPVVGINFYFMSCWCKCSDVSYEIMTSFFQLLQPLGPAFSLVLDFLPLWLPIILLYGAWKMWIVYVRAKYIATEDTVLLEIKIPREINKSPLAMEIVLNTFHNTLGETTFIDRYIKGQVRTWFSLEMVSIGGEVRFFIWGWKKFSKGIENYLYSQYPEIEIHEVDDYVFAPFNGNEAVDIFGSELKLTKPDPYPLKTYIDYGLDKDPKEEFKIDPITPVIEYLGSLGPGEQAWVQILIRAHKDEDKKHGVWFLPWTWFKTTDKWKDDVKVEIDKIVSKRKIQGVGADDEETKNINLTQIEKDTITALERSVTKLPFDTGIRFVYVATVSAFNPANKGGFLGSLKQFSADNLNGFKPNGNYSTGFDYPWEDFRDIRLTKRKQQLFDAYRQRSYFHPPHKRKHFVLNTEELATIYHFPGDVAQTPTFERLESQKSGPPTNLPI